MRHLFALLVSTSLAVAAPPRVLETVPQNGAKHVDPAVNELRVLFDQPMSTAGMSVVGGGPTFPKFIGKPRWENDRTFVWAWQLGPQREYWLSINSDRFNNFRGQSGEPLKPYPISFNTGQGSGVTVRHREAIAHLRRAILEDYSYADLRAVNWGERFGVFSARLEAASTPDEFARIAAELLAPAHDTHLWLKVGEQTFPTFQRSAQWNIDVASLPRRVPKWRMHNGVIGSGVIEGGIQYICIRSWPKASRDLEPAFELLTEAARVGHSLIVDVRANGGGSETSARELAGCFADRPVAYAKHEIRRDGRFGAVQTRRLHPNKDRPQFTNRVAVLMGQGTVSSSEAFVLMMKQNPRCTLVGDHTAGASGNPVPIDLGNGATAFIPSWRSLNLAGESLEGKGVAPDRSVEFDASSLSPADPVLAAAVALLRGTNQKP